ncbi:MAG: flagellar motor protein MotB [Thermodesulfobacteriota bacterium]
MQKNEKEGGNKPIIIKKIQKGGHGGHHGGSWKVAYADFVTAMMAFFLLMWLISAASKEQKEHLAGYFKEFSLFDYKGVSDVPGQSEQVPPEHQSATLGDVQSDEEIAEMLSSHLEDALAELKDQIIVEVFDQGVRIEATHKEDKALFDSGSSAPTPIGQKILSEIGVSIKDLPNSIAIEGHTDAVKYSGDEYTNWELSTDRASMARRILGQSGVDSGRIVRVSGFASARPLNKADPYDPKNRRISVLLFNENVRDSEM